ncbi:MAG: PEP/pyruvate-binding domain-containing protein, partial [Nitrososphaerales archaeon]
MEILWLGETACHNVSIVGGKAAHLSRLASRNHVPRGFCISASLNEIRQLIKEMQENQRDQVKSAELRRKVRFAYEKLSGTNHLKGVGVAVRSSSTEEDTKEASF